MFIHAFTFDTFLAFNLPPSCSLYCPLKDIDSFKYKALYLRMFIQKSSTVKPMIHGKPSNIFFETYC